MKLFRLAAAVMTAAMLFTSCGADTTEPKDYSSRSSAEIVSDCLLYTSDAADEL